MNAPHKNRAHAVLGGSGTAIWMNCPASPRLSKGIEKSTSSFAAEGTVFHELVELCIRTKTDPSDYVGEVKVCDGHKITIDEEMAEHADQARRFYRDLVDGDGAAWEIQVEQRVDLSHLHPAMFGTADFVAYNPETKHLRIADLKYGRGVAVDPRENKQGLFYALGAVYAHHNRGLDKVTISIFQPRAAHPAGPARHWETDAIELMEFKADLIDAAKATEDPNAEPVAGDWCRFCAAAAVCPALRKRAGEIAAAEFAEHDDSYDREALARALADADIVEAWLHRTREFAHAEAVAGRVPPGWKLVAKRATRKWKDADTAVKSLTVITGVEDEHLYEKKFLTPAKMEKALKQHYGFKGKAATAEIEDLVEKVSSGVVLAPESDARPAVRPDAAAEFGSDEGDDE